ncbi:hypothetical protein LZG04_40795 [Saccharothrix sp. S26]|uniref:hypothetical protein n=1 Tax=Saccharothrix sp. S26 TaxID=2907215 RepID=UPI001F4060FC|nr:hypothetical protein [Saccharothrix sp. S26]MCE7001114.1 hypothetical protein [Saccharothrix sp. S26]
MVVFAIGGGMFGLVRKAGLDPIRAGLEQAEAFAPATDHLPDAVPPQEVPVVIAKVFGDVQVRRVFADLAVFGIANLAAERMGVHAVRHTIGPAGGRHLPDLVAGGRLPGRRRPDPDAPHHVK